MLNFWSQRVFIGKNWKKILKCDNYINLFLRQVSDHKNFATGFWFTHWKMTVLLSVTVLPNATSLEKEHLFEKAQQVFVHDGVDVVDGYRVLGSVIGSDRAEKNTVERSLKQQNLLLRRLAAHSNVSPQNDFKSFISSVRHKLTFLARTTIDFEDL